MIESFNSYNLNEIQQGSLFILTAMISMLYHYADRWLSGEQRVLTSGGNIWEAGKILVQLFFGSTFWAHMYDLSNVEIVVAGMTIGMLAFSKGIVKFSEHKNG